MSTARESERRRTRRRRTLAHPPARNRRVTHAPPRPLGIRRRLELGRLLVGSLLETAIKAYGVGAVAAVALSDAETAGGKASDAVRAVPSLAEEYDQARYVVDHREEIQAAVTYLNENTLPQDELQRTADESVRTLGAIETTYDEVGAARDVLELDGISGTIDNVREAIEHVGNAYSARPDLDSLEQLADVAEQVGRPCADQVDVLIPVYYGGLITRHGQLRERRDRLDRSSSWRWPSGSPPSSARPSASGSAAAGRGSSRSCCRRWARTSSGPGTSQPAVGPQPAAVRRRARAPPARDRGGPGGRARPRDAPRARGALREQG